jgi:O-acetyl-ADP-ribose deacetylase (regulator of RNase III)
MSEMSNTVKIMLVDRGDEMVDAWEACFANQTHVSCHVADIKDFWNKSQAFVSASNSQLFFDGGSDLAYMKLFPGVQSTMKRYVTNFGFEDNVGRTDYLPVGAACIKSFDDKYLICAPTMFLPQDVSTTNNAYVAFKLVLELLDKNPQVRSVVVPGLCCGYGKMTHEKAANQMFRAYIDHQQRKNSLDSLGPEHTNIVHWPSYKDTQPHYFMNRSFIDFDASTCIFI